jgi:hypothetical protein
VIFNNPLIQRYRYSLMRPRQLWIYITVYVGVVALILFINYTAYQYNEFFETQTRSFRGVFYQFLIFQMVVLWIFGAVGSGSAIREEITGKSYDFFRMLPLSAGQKAAGILVGKNLIVFILTAFNFIFLIIFGRLGELSYSLLGQSVLALLSIAVLADSVALLSSIRQIGSKRKTNIVVLIVLLVIFLPMFVPAVVTLVVKFQTLEYMTGTFYTTELPILILVSLIALYFSCWSIKGILRKFTHEDEPLFNRIGAFFFMLGYEFVLFGLFYQRLEDGAWRINYWFWLFSLLPVLLIPFGSIRSFDSYLEHSGLIRSKSANNKTLISQLFLYSNLSLDLGLFIVWAICATGTTLITRQDLICDLSNVFTLFTFYLFIISLFELYVVYVPVSNKVGILLGFIAFVYMFLPLIVSEILNNEIVRLHSPLGFFSDILIHESGPDTWTKIFICLINLALCIIPFILISKRYKHILAAREKM